MSNNGKTANLICVRTMFTAIQENIRRHGFFSSRACRHCNRCYSCMCQSFCSKGQRDYKQVSHNDIVEAMMVLEIKNHDGEVLSQVI